MALGPGLIDQPAGLMDPHTLSACLCGPFGLAFPWWPWKMLSSLPSLHRFSFHITRPAWRDGLGAGTPRISPSVLGSSAPLLGVAPGERQWCSDFLVTDIALLRRAPRPGDGLISAFASQGWLERCVVLSLHGGCLTGAAKASVPFKTGSIQYDLGQVGE